MQHTDKTSNKIKDGKIKDKVQKLLNQAADREGTPEGESFYAKAFALMAEYGFDTRDLRANSTDEANDVSHKTFTFTGTYTDMQAKLLLAIAEALHCTGFYQRVYRSTRAQGATIFGLRRHLERVDLLYALLLPQMMAGARGVSSNVVQRRSFMTGFAGKVGQRLAEAEEHVAKQESGYGLMLIDDSEKARTARDDYAAEQGFVVGRARTNRALDAAAYFRGQDAGSLTDIGQQRLRSRPALPF